VCAPDQLGAFEVNQRRLEWHASLGELDGPLDDPPEGPDE
jgi:hypothetical protein